MTCSMDFNETPFFWGVGVGFELEFYWKQLSRENKSSNAAIIQSFRKSQGINATKGPIGICRGCCCFNKCLMLQLLKGRSYPKTHFSKPNDSLSFHSVILLLGLLLLLHKCLKLQLLKGRSYPVIHFVNQMIQAFHSIIKNQRSLYSFFLLSHREALQSSKIGSF